MVSASYLPLLAGSSPRVAGTSDLTAANVGLVVAIVLLTVHRWLAGRAAQLQVLHDRFCNSRPRHQRSRMDSPCIIDYCSSPQIAHLAWLHLILDGSASDDS